MYDLWFILLIVIQSEAKITMTINLDLEKFESNMSQTNAEGVVQYIVEVFLFGFDK